MRWFIIPIIPIFFLNNTLPIQDKDDRFYDFNHEACRIYVTWNMIE